MRWTAPAAVHRRAARSQVSPYITVSIGIASARCHPDLPGDRWIAEADRQLYESKQGGRNRISGGEFALEPVRC
jgi:GGDEF domain-containing protein